MNVIADNYMRIGCKYQSVSMIKGVPTGRATKIRAEMVWLNKRHSVEQALSLGAEENAI